MGLLSNISKAYAAQKLLVFLTKDIEKLQAFKLGIIDAMGKQIVKTRDMTSQQKAAWGPFEKICLYVRRVLRNHGVPALAIALTYLEDEKYDEFLDHIKLCITEEEEISKESYGSSYPLSPLQQVYADNRVGKIISQDQQRGPKPGGLTGFQYSDINQGNDIFFKQTDDFFSSVMLIEALEEVFKKDEDAPVTSTAGIATYPTPLMDKKTPKAKDGFTV